MIAKIIGRAVPGWELADATISFFTPFEPQWLVSDQQQAWMFRVPVGATPGNWAGWAMTAC